MTRINTHVPIIDEHLRAARREYCRIPNEVAKAYTNSQNMPEYIASLKARQPEKYTVQTASNPKGGRGHMLFFYDKLMFVHKQYLLILQECFARGFTCDSWWPDYIPTHYGELYNDWTPKGEDVFICKIRQIERIPKNPHILGVQVSQGEAHQAIITGCFPDRLIPKGIS